VSIGRETLALLIEEWPGIGIEDRIEILRADPDSLELAWHAATQVQRKKFTVMWRDHQNAIWNDATLKPIGQDVDLIRQIEMVRRALPRDAAVQNVCTAFEAVLPYVPKGRLPGTSA